MRAALAFLTPLGGARAPDARTLAWFPLVGAVLGGVLGAVWWAAAELWSPAVAAAVVVATDLALTGMLHLDGLADSADGLLGHRPRERRLAIMADPTVGAYGVAVVVSVLLLRAAALASMTPEVVLLAGLWCASRTVMAVAARALPSARPGSLVTGLAGAGWRAVAAQGVVAVVLLGGLGGGRAAVAVVVALAAGAGVVLLGRARLGGVTGDVLGAAGVVAESAGLLAGAARW